MGNENSLTESSNSEFKNLSLHKETKLKLIQKHFIRWKIKLVSGSTYNMPGINLQYDGCRLAKKSAFLCQKIKSFEPWEITNFSLICGEKFKCLIETSLVHYSALGEPLSNF